MKQLTIYKYQNAYEIISCMNNFIQPVPLNIRVSRQVMHQSIITGEIWQICMYVLNKWRNYALILRVKQLMLILDKMHHKRNICLLAGSYNT